MTDAGSCSRLTQTPFSGVVISWRFKTAVGFQFLPKVLARASKTGFNKSNTYVGVNGAKGIVGDVNLCQRCSAEERGFAHVGFADQTNAHESTPSADSLLFFRGDKVVVSLDLCDSDVKFREVEFTVSIQVHAFNEFAGVNG